jgi:hypothetical protein
MEHAVTTKPPGQLGGFSFRCCTAKISGRKDLAKLPFAKDKIGLRV